MLLLRKKLRSNILLVVDDAYFEFVVNKDYASGLDLFRSYSNVLITRSFSKIYGLASLRLGWGYGSKNIISAMKLIKPPFNVNSAAQAAGVEALNDKNWLKNIAAAGSGKYFDIEKGNEIFRNLKKELNRIEKEEFDTKNFDEYQSFYQLFVLLALGLLLADFIISFRKEPLAEEDKKTEISETLKIEEY